MDADTAFTSAPLGPASPSLGFRARLKSSFARGGSAVLRAASAVTPHLPGAVDVLVVQQPDGTLRSTPFYVRFGKYVALGSKDRTIKVLVNDRLAPFEMYLGSHGSSDLAYFLEPADATLATPDQPCVAGVPEAAEVEAEFAAAVEAELSAGSSSSSHGGEEEGNRGPGVWADAADAGVGPGAGGQVGLAVGGIGPGAGDGVGSAAAAGEVPREAAGAAAPGGGWAHAVCQLLEVEQRQQRQQQLQWQDQQQVRPDEQQQQQQEHRQQAQQQQQQPHQQQHQQQQQPQQQQQHQQQQQRDVFATVEGSSISDPACTMDMGASGRAAGPGSPPALGLGGFSSEPALSSEGRRAPHQHKPGETSGAELPATPPLWHTVNSPRQRVQAQRGPGQRPADGADAAAVAVAAVTAAMAQGLQLSLCGSLLLGPPPPPRSPQGASRPAVSSEAVQEETLTGSVSTTQSAGAAGRSTQASPAGSTASVSDRAAAAVDSPASSSGALSLAEAHAVFERHRVSVGDFAASGAQILASPELMVRVAGSIFPWAAAAPLVIGASWEQLVPVDSPPRQGAPFRRSNQPPLLARPGAVATGPEVTLDATAEAMRAGGAAAGGRLKRGAGKAGWWPFARLGTREPAGRQEQQQQPRSAPTSGDISAASTSGRAAGSAATLEFPASGSAVAQPQRPARPAPRSASAPLAAKLAAVGRGPGGEEGVGVGGVPGPSAAHAPQHPTKPSARLAWRAERGKRLGGGSDPGTGASAPPASTAGLAASQRLPSDGADDAMDAAAKPALKKVLTPTCEQLASLQLLPGRNRIVYRTGASTEQSAFIYLIRWDAKIVISDVDGTVTKSDVLGHLLPAIGLDWSHAGMPQLLTSIADNGYQVMYLSSRSIGQANITRDYLNTIRQGPAGHRMPMAPVIISPDGILPSLYREMILRRPHEFKIATLQEIRALFPRECNPFYAGFGNRDTDEISYKAVGVPPGRIFIINPAGELRKASVTLQASTWSSLRAVNELAGTIFPPISGMQAHAVHQGVPRTRTTPALGAGGTSAGAGGLGGRRSVEPGAQEEGAGAPPKRAVTSLALSTTEAVQADERFNDLHFWGSPGASSPLADEELMARYSAPAQPAKNPVSPVLSASPRPSSARLSSVGVDAAPGPGFGGGAVGREGVRDSGEFLASYNPFAA